MTKNWFQYEKNISSKMKQIIIIHVVILASSIGKISSDLFQIYTDHEYYTRDYWKIKISCNGITWNQTNPVVFYSGEEVIFDSSSQDKKCKFFLIFFKLLSLFFYLRSSKNCWNLWKSYIGIEICKNRWLDRCELYLSRIQKLQDYDSVSKRSRFVKYSRLFCIE